MVISVTDDFPRKDTTSLVQLLAEANTELPKALFEVVETILDSKGDPEDAINHLISTTVAKGALTVSKNLTLINDLITEVDVFLERSLKDLKSEGWLENSRFCHPELAIEDVENIIAALERYERMYRKRMDLLNMIEKLERNHKDHAKIRCIDELLHAASTLIDLHARAEACRSKLLIGGVSSDASLSLEQSEDLETLRTRAESLVVNHPDLKSLRICQLPVHWVERDR